MRKFLRKLGWNKKGFTLTEVMIGIMILTVAIVAASNLLIGLLRTNQNNLTTLQAYYLAQEGLEAVRNIRDTNWLHNQDWMNPDIGNKLWNQGFQKGQEYVVHLEPDGLSGFTDAIETARPWVIEGNFVEGGFIKKYENSYVTSKNLSEADSVSGVEDPGFKRVISIKPYDCEKLNEKEGQDFDCDSDKYVLVESKVGWMIGAKERELTLHEVLTDWKGGAL